MAEGTGDGGGGGDPPGEGGPFIPSIVVNGFQTPMEQLQAGIFGLGSNNSLNQWTGRDDVSVQPLWQLQNSGSGTSR